MESTPDAYAAAFRKLLAGWEELVEPLSDDQFNWKPAPDKWSVAQCMDHVSRIATRYLPALEEKLSAGGPAGEPPFAYDFRGRLLIRGTGPAGATRKTLKAMEPTEGRIDRAGALLLYRSNTARFVNLVERARGLDLSRIRMHSPYTPRIPFLTFPIGAVFEGTAGHDMRHLGQARRVVEGMGTE